MKKLIIANWKMQLNYRDGLGLARKFTNKIIKADNEIVVCPDYLILSSLPAIFKKTGLKLGAQDCASVDRGACTGEISPLDLKNLGAKYVILGHSERRQGLNENSAVINAKIKAALRNDLIPVLCIGENLGQKESGQTKKVLNEELRLSLKGVKIKTSASLVVAYEPLWAIGTGQPIIPVEAEIMSRFIKDRVAKILGKKVSIIYGGSVDSANAAEFLKQKNIGGLLVGNASLDAPEFNKISRL
ncbi:MAG: triose-phosphate isomerase [Patescibacteria group bacterium]|jgi:triosephosphate isomerase